MNREQLAEQLDREIEALMETVAPAKLATSDTLFRLAAELRLLPREDFRAGLRRNLLAEAETLQPDRACSTSEILQSLNGEQVPSFSTRQMAVLPADPRSLFFSFLSHAAVIALIASGIWVSHEKFTNDHVKVTELTYPLSGNDGGGGGGDRSAVRASRGTPPKFSDAQLAPTTIVVHVEKPKLPEDSTVLGPPDLKLQQSKQIGDLFASHAVIPSNGTGRGGGIGGNKGTGDGSGAGGGVGIGSKVGIGGGIYRPGQGVTAPHVIYNPDPEYSDEARRIKFQGNVILSLIVDPAGHVQNVRVARSLGMGLDEKAVEAVQKWRFAPGMKDGHPVAVQVNVEVSFRLY